MRACETAMDYMKTIQPIEFFVDERQQSGSICYILQQFLETKAEATLAIFCSRLFKIVNNIEIINNTRAGIVIFFRSKKGNALLGGKFKSQMQGQALIG